MKSPLLLLGPAALVAVACSTPYGTEASDWESPRGGKADESGIVDQGSLDVTVLRANVTLSSGGVDLDTAACIDLPPLHKDCTQVFEEAMGLPSLHAIIVPASDDPSPVLCQVLEVDTLSKSSAIRHAEGIGFYYRGFPGLSEIHFTPESELVQVDGVELKSGEPARIHRFAGLANCWLGTASSTAHATYVFKPFMAFTTPDTLYRNWDVANDYVISTQITSFDRSNELLLAP